MKQFVVGSALLMLVWSLSTGYTDSHVAVSPQPITGVQNAAFEQFFGDTFPPPAYVVFCQTYTLDCRPQGAFTDRIQRTGPKFIELKKVNDQVNATVVPMPDLEHYGKRDWWAYPVDNKGDCEDYVLEKRRRLIARGWPQSTLLITVVRDESNDGHAVLTVRTNEGDLILDNKRGEIVSWADTPYTFIKAQSQRNPLLWVSLLPPNFTPQPVVSASNSH
jgi:predicted transglutaminase-like cysteine proteinase